VTLPADLRAFVDEQRWTFAKTMPGWPHEYIVRGRVDEQLFERLVVHIRTHGVEGKFYERAITCYEEAGPVYWTMGATLHETTIVNRCRSEETYVRRLARGTLPQSTGEAIGRPGWVQQAHLAQSRVILERARAEPAAASYTSAGFSPAKTSPAINAAASSCIAGMACEEVQRGGSGEP